MIDSITRLQHLLHRQQLDAFLVSQPENRRFLSGYSAADHNISESSGFLLIPRTGRPFLLTDFRFQLQAEREATAFDVIIYRHGLLPTLKKLLPQLSVKSLAFEANYFLHAKYLTLAQLCSLQSIQLTAFDAQIERLRLIKNEDELAAIKRSVQLNETVFQHIYSSIRPGQTELEVALAIESAMRLHGAERPSFDTIVASGPNGALPHAVPSHRRLAQGEPVVIDMGLILAGYCSDMTRTIVLGTPDPHTVKLFRLVRKAQLAGLDSLRPGVSGRHVDKSARDVIKEAGFGPCFGHALGHGLGLAVHEAPSLSFRNRKLLRSGMVVTVEPGIYIKDWGGIRLENVAVVTDLGNEVLNSDTTFLDI